MWGIHDEIRAMLKTLPARLETLSPEDWVGLEASFGELEEAMSSMGYQGNIEVTQDVTEIRHLEGERRLLHDT